MDLSVDIAICTWNRAELLDQTLRSVTGLVVPAGLQWRVIVVPNRCTDRTMEVLDAYAGRLPLVVAPEPLQGHSQARNRAVAESTGDLILWTDDDVVVAPDWLAEMVRAAAGHPDDTFFGGVIAPVFPGGRPGWIADNWETVKGCFAARDLGPVAVALTGSQLPYGANFAVRGAVQRRYLFDTGLGRRGTIATGEDELELLRRLMRDGHTGRWVPAARVDHVIPPERATTRAVFQYFEGQGRILASKGVPWTRSPWRLWLAECWHAAMYGIQRRWARSPAWLGHLARSALARGQRHVLAGRPGPNTAP